MILYHITREEDRGNFLTGYVGVTSRDNITIRYKEHLVDGNNYLKNALNKYDDIVYYPIFEGDELECLRLEHVLRPVEKVGWNLAIGGGKPPSGTNKGKTLFNIQGKNNYQYKGIYVTPKGCFYSSTKAAKANSMGRTTLWRYCKDPHKLLKNSRYAGLTPSKLGFYFVT